MIAKKVTESDSVMVQVPEAVTVFFNKKLTDIEKIQADGYLEIYKRCRSYWCPAVVLASGFNLFYQQADGAYPAQYYYYLGTLVRLFVDHQHTDKSGGAILLCTRKEAGWLGSILNYAIQYVRNSQGEWDQDFKEGLRYDLGRLQNFLYSVS